MKLRKKKVLRNKETLSLDLKNLGFTETEIKLGLGIGYLFLDTRCESCNKKMYKEVVGFMITPNMINPEPALVCYSCGNIKRLMT